MRLRHSFYLFASLFACGGTTTTTATPDPPSYTCVEEPQCGTVPERGDPCELALAQERELYSRLSARGIRMSPSNPEHFQRCAEATPSEQWCWVSAYACSHPSECEHVVPPQGIFQFSIGSCF
ncbi:MAG: hypothetical protein AB8H86_33745 [Polyangiales bacterium]